MIFRPYYYFDLGCAAYLFGCGTLIYPGHFSGSVCGTDLSEKPTSTLAFEKRWNSMLSLDREEFIEALSDVPPKPADVERVLAFNRGHDEAGARA